MEESGPTQNHTPNNRKPVQISIRKVIAGLTARRGNLNFIYIFTNRQQGFLPAPSSARGQKTPPNRRIFLALGEKIKGKKRRQHQ